MDKRTAVAKKRAADAARNEAIAKAYAAYDEAVADITKEE